MLIIGGPLWFFFWRNAQRHAEKNQTETGSLTRKVYLNLILVVTALMSLFAAQDFLEWLMSGLREPLKCRGQFSHSDSHARYMVLPLADIRNGRPPITGSHDSQAVVCLHRSRMGTWSGSWWGW